MQLAKELPAPERLHELLEYRNGHLYWRTQHLYRTPAGALAEGLGKGGYLRTYIDHKRYPTHRLIWSLHYGYLDRALEVDHINRKHADNRIQNLRAVTHQENGWNQGRNLANRTGHVGLVLRQNKRCAPTWVAQITLLPDHYYLGSYRTKKEAIAARRAAEMVLRKTKTPIHEG